MLLLTLCLAFGGLYKKTYREVNKITGTFSPHFLNRKRLQKRRNMREREKTFNSKYQWALDKFGITQAAYCAKTVYYHLLSLLPLPLTFFFPHRNLLLLNKNIREGRGLPVPDLHILCIPLPSCIYLFPPLSYQYFTIPNSTKRMNNAIFYLFFIA